MKLYVTVKRLNKLMKKNNIQWVKFKRGLQEMKNIKNTKKKKKKKKKRKEKYVMENNFLLFHIQ